ncbi:ABC transporter permease subunit [Litchfieldella xinjiangensis]|uniref:ABC transporter permease subunit n=1 Tax=Litchfieldella xinjiangensis TaxID=1166948 RepID=UPI0005BDDF64|nr:ABC transporter permease subunit [Halomonas xinjiangensis]
MIDPPHITPARRTRSRSVRDRLATWLISACGIGVIVAVMAIGVFLAVEVMPLFTSPDVETRETSQAPGSLVRSWHITSDALPTTGSGEPQGLTARGEGLLWRAEGRHLEVVRLGEEASNRVERVTAVDADRRITALAVLAGGRALIVGDDQGGLQRWVSGPDSPVPQATGPYRTPHRAAIQRILPLPEQRLFLAWDADDRLALYQAITGHVWSGTAPQGEPLGIDEQGQLWWGDDSGIQRLTIDAEHAEVSLGSVWLAQHYEGHAEPQHRWQASVSQASDEPRFGMTPLAWGTLKAATYALLFAIPLGLGAAIHSACFMSHRLRHRLKPTLEMMEAMPGVVIGFIAGLVLAPYVDRHLAGALSLLVILPLGMLAGGWLWSRLTPRLRHALPLGWAGVWLMPWLALLVVLAMTVSPGIERLAFEGDLPSWLEREMGLDYASRNALIIGVAMGFAVIPTIYALAEDALSGVPASLGEGAQALGATRWQTLWRVVLPAASPGIFSAVMIGAGRAVGETMIVLMATGNTAILSASPLDGLRSLASNIAIELPEAAVGGTHYRLLMFSALVLFAFTFIANTLAEWVRTRLDRRYRRLEGR